MIAFTINGQIKSGKNNMIVTRTGKRFPNKEWSKWRDGIVSYLKSIWKDDIIDYPIRLSVFNYNGDKRRRDISGQLDALFHCLERAEIVSDDRDSIISQVEWITGYNKENPHTCVTIKRLNND